MLLSLIGAAILLFLVHATLWLVVYLAVDGLILVSAMLLELAGLKQYPQ